MTYAMKKALNILTGLLVLVALGFQTSCSKDDEDTVEPNDYCYISGFTLGTLTRYVTSTDDDGTEITTTLTYAGSYYPVAIDHVAGTITSSVPLLVGTDLTIVPATINGGGYFTYRPVGSESEWTAFTSGNYVDFSTPLVFRATATDGKSYRDYVVTLIVRDNDPNAYTWEQMMPQDDATSLLEGRAERKAVAWGDGLAILSIDTNNDIHLTATPKTEAPTWADVLCTGASGAELSTMQVMSDKMWMSTTDGALLQSADGATWSTVVQTTSGTTVRLLGASKDFLYAAINGTSVCTSADGITWTETSMDSESNLFPTADCASLYYAQSNENKRMLLVGNNGENTTTWSRIEKDNEQWTLISATGDHDYILPWTDLEETSLVSYSDKIIAIGHTAETYITSDNGLTWKTYEELSLTNTALPESGEKLSATAAGEYIWVITGSSIWRARLNGFGE